jgi:hypothetical protein
VRLIAAGVAGTDDHESTYGSIFPLALATLKKQCRSLDTNEVPTPFATRAGVCASCNLQWCEDGPLFAPVCSLAFRSRLLPLLCLSYLVQTCSRSVKSTTCSTIKGRATDAFSRPTTFSTINSIFLSSWHLLASVQSSSAAVQQCSELELAMKGWVVVRGVECRELRTWFCAHRSPSSTFSGGNLQLLTQVPNSGASSPASKTTGFLGDSSPAILIFKITEQIMQI